MAYKTISIPLSDDELQALTRAASQECRKPRDHIRYVLLSGLGLTRQGATKNKPVSAQTWTGATDNGLVSSNR